MLKYMVLNENITLNTFNQFKKERLKGMKDVVDRKKYLEVYEMAKKW